jgi:four helix bundle protein
MNFKKLIKSIDFNSTNWENFDWGKLGLDWENYGRWDLSGLTSEEVGKLNVLHGYWLIYGHSSRNSPVNSRSNLPFSIPKLEKIDRQSQKPRGYRASALWQTASLLYDLVRLYTVLLPKSEHRLKAQIDDAGRSMVANIEEGYARPTTLEYLEFLGFAYASWAEVDGDIERMYSLGFLKSRPGSSLATLGIATPSRNLPYPPINSRKNPGKYGSLREKLREYTGRGVGAKEMSYQAFKELSNKTGYLFKQTANGLRNKIIKDKKKGLETKLETIWRKYW